VRVAVGLPAAGVDGFRQSHREAIDAQRLAVSVGSKELFTAYADVELVCLMTRNEEGARGLVERELGGLAAPDSALDRVRETVQLFLSNGGNVDLTASMLTVHKNTIRYRLAQAEELIGHPLSERRTEVDVALRCLALTR
jgi:DNA-binding PucR family transcriptional regulator